MTGLPLVNYSSDTGFGYGVRAFLFNNGSRTDPLFRETPYSAQVFLQYFATTSGWQYHWFYADFPAVGASGFRVRGGFVYEKNTNRNYFGVGEASLHGLPGTTCDKWQKTLDESEPRGAGSTEGWFNRYSLTRPLFYIQFEHALAGPFSMMFGSEIHKTTVDTYDGKTVPVNSGKLVQGPTLLALDSPRGIRGGWNNKFRTGLSYDTRDFEPAPKDGWYADLTGEYAGPALGADFSYTRETWTVRRYQPVVRGLTAAMRGTFAVTQGTPPFFDYSTMGFFQGWTEGLGGGYSLRGYKANRFAGPVTALANLELRWDAAEWLAGGQRFLLTPILLADGGRVFDRAKDFRLADWKAGAGGGARIAWNQATILNLTYGRSGEDTTIFINFGHTF